MTKLLITRPHPAPVLDAARAICDVTLRDSVDPLSPDELRAAVRDYDAILPTLGDAFSEHVFMDVPNARTRILANFGVGYNHIDTIAAARHGIAVMSVREGLAFESPIESDSACVGPLVLDAVRDHAGG